MFARKKNFSTEKNSGVPHPDYEVVATSVSDYFRKYAQGKIEEMPQDHRPTVVDDRSPDDMVNDESVTNHLGCDDLDALQEYEANREKYEAAINEVELSGKQKEVFLSATKVLDDPNSTADQRREAYEALQDLGEKVARARKT